MQKFKKKFNNKNKPAFNPKATKSVKEEVEIKTLQGSYAGIDPKEIQNFDQLPLSQKTLKGLRENKFKVPTEIQKQSISHSLQGKDVLGAAITGSGKTLAFLIPIIENLYVRKWTRLDGLGAIIISPTRELAYQIFETLKKIGAHHELSAGLIIGGKNLKFEKTRMDQCNIMICTPGRLLQHMDENPLFNCTSMQILVLDEADRCLDMGFSETIDAIIENLPPDRQTLLFSATQTKSVKDLARLSLKDPVYVAPHDTSEHSTPNQLQQNFVVVELQDKVTMLWSFIKSHLKQKSIVFLSTCKEVKYLHEMFTKLRPGVALLALYGTLHQDRRMSIYDEFCRKNKVILFATDIASRGLHFPVVNWVIQLDCPEDATQYIHRAGRTARHRAHGESLLVLLPSERHMLNELKAQKIPINEINIDPRRMFSPAVKMEGYVAQSTELKESAQRAFVSYIKSVAMMKNKKIFNVETLNFDEYAKSLGLVVTPRVRFLQRMKKKKDQKPKSQREQEVSDEESAQESESDDNIPDPKPTTDLNSLMDDESDDSDAGLITIKRKDHKIDDNESEEDETPLEEIKSSRKPKKVTKASLAKKIMKKNIQANKKITYDEDGQEVTNTAKQLQSDLAKEYIEADEGGIDIEKAKELLQEEDKFDRQRFKELVKAKHQEQKKKRKQRAKEELEGSDFDSDQEDDFGSESGEENNSGEDSGPDFYQPESENEEETFHKPPTQLYEKKKRSMPKSESSDQSSEDEPISKKQKTKFTSKLNLLDAESLAMSLLDS